jgi:hypothetical protein
MTHPTPVQLGLYLAWTFTEVLPGTFQRDRKECVGKEFKIIGPLPKMRGKSPPLPIEGAHLDRPYIYFLFDARGTIAYVGKAVGDNLKTPLGRWVRPNKAHTAHFWSHGTNETKSTVDQIADGLKAGEGPYKLYFSNHAYFIDRVRARSRAIGMPFHRLEALPPKEFIKVLEPALIYCLQPEWNEEEKDKRPAADIEACAAYWLV